jgi:membrane-bound lytic murein transglycosylase B
MTLFREISNVSRRVYGYTQNIAKQRGTSFFTIVSIFSVAFSPVKFEVVKQPVVESDTVQRSETTLNLATDSASVLSVVSKVSSIVPGDSAIQKEDAAKQAAILAEAAKQAEAKKSATLTKSRETVSRERRVYSDPSDFDVIYQNAGSTFGVDWKLLKAIHKVETGSSGSTYRSNPSGATGPMQFLPSTFKRHGQDGNGDGIKDISNVEDAIFSAAGYLRACGYPDAKKALWGYNPSTSYYNKVMGIARSYGM